MKLLFILFIALFGYSTAYAGSVTIYAQCMHGYDSICETGQTFLRWGNNQLIKMSIVPTPIVIPYLKGVEMITLQGYMRGNVDPFHKRIFSGQPVVLPVQNVITHGCNKVTVQPSEKGAYVHVACNPTPS